MKLLLTLDISRLESTSLKGEDLRNEVVSYLECVEIEGWEVQRVSITEREVKPLDLQVVSKLRGVCFKIASEASSENPKYTNQEMADYWLSLLTQGTEI